MLLKLSEIKPNPANPRFVRDDAFKKLVASLQSFPEMAEVRPVVLNVEHMILGGNVRYRAAKEAGWTEMPVTIVDWPEDKQREFIIKDNVSGGEWDWDQLANEWTDLPLEEWGLDIPTSFDKEPELTEGETPESEEGVEYQLGVHILVSGVGTKTDLKRCDAIRKNYAKLIGEDDWRAATPAIT